MPKKKVHFPQIPLTELKKILRSEARVTRRPPNVSMEKRKGNEPYSRPLLPEEYKGEWHGTAFGEGRGVGARSFREI